MKVTVNPTFDIATGKLISHEGVYEYSGPVIRLDRSATNEAKSAETNAANLAGTEGANAASTEATLNPFYQSEMTTQHMFTPSELGELNTSAQSGAGAATGQAEEQAKLNAARTGNSAALSGSEDEIARAGAKAAAGASEGVASEDVMGAKQLNQEGAAGEAGLYGTDTSAMLSAMGLQNQDVETQIKAGQSGWFQNLLGGINAVTGATNAVTGFVKANPNGMFGG